MLRLFIATVAGDLEYLHITAQEDLEKIKTDIVSEVYEDTSAIDPEIDVELNEFQEVRPGSSTFIADFEFPNPR